MATVDELKNVLKETLENRGVLGQIRARIRAEVFSALDDQTEARPTLSNENLLINELIREYLTFNKYKYTESVLLAETGQPKDPMDRQFLVQELNITEDQTASPSMPLLYEMLAYYLQGGHREGRRLRGLRDESLQPRTAESRQRRHPDGLLHTQDRDERRLHSSFGHDPEPVIVRGGRR
ncbi:unnamed protein product [Porites evermanni]|uniref:FGFR1 oncogene partner (FOP) N-terminal dimerisation domain-containing protein n=1 Tax=Porites evermanni TaxID=104178 RepID=A0ABN8RNZ8_9CNID|nr:unnamed protein product [Porites evermanni]